MSNSNGDTGKPLAAIAYLTIFGAIISIMMNLEKKNEFIAFHCRQGLGLNIAYLLVGYVISQLDSMMVSMGFWIFFGVLFFYGIIGAVTGKYNEVPILGPLFQNWFKNLGR